MVSDSGDSGALDRHFAGAAFEDALFNTDNNAREKACAWKIMRSPHFWQLTNDSWKWRAVGIPLNLRDRTLQGDIDMMFAVRVHANTENGGHDFSTLYRCF